MIRIAAWVLIISIGFLVPKAAAQSDQYSKMATVDQYLMERNSEILLARSAAPDSISKDATVLVLRRQGYEVAVRGKNGFVCMVERSWMEAFDAPEFWNPKVRGAECLNRLAARSIVPIAELRTKMVLTGHSKAEIVAALKAAFRNQFVGAKADDFGGPFVPLCLGRRSDGAAFRIDTFSRYLIHDPIHHLHDFHYLI